MRFIFGGAFQGQEMAAVSLFNLRKEDICDGRSCEFEEIYSCKGMNHFHIYIRRLLEKDTVIAGDFVNKLMNRNPDIILISQEIGYGIVPMDAFERLWREQTGRVSCEIAQSSDVVVRVLAGVPMYLKGEPI